MDKGKIGRSSYIFDNVYVLSSAGVVGPKEAIGPYGKYFEHCYDKLNISNKSFEKSDSNKDIGKDDKDNKDEENSEEYDEKEIPDTSNNVNEDWLFPF